MIEQTAKPQDPLRFSGLATVAKIQTARHFRWPDPVFAVWRFETAPIALHIPARMSPLHTLPPSHVCGDGR